MPMCMHIKKRHIVPFFGLIQFIESVYMFIMAHLNEKYLRIMIQPGSYIMFKVLADLNKKVQNCEIYIQRKQNQATFLKPGTFQANRPNEGENILSPS
ncbi:hypothetical protein GQX74_011745 [Glossina fuscipes]|nr:hypothetical protein GQX74_011745 [Glossina fuscipes]